MPPPKQPVPIVHKQPGLALRRNFQCTSPTPPTLLPIPLSTPSQPLSHVSPSPTGGTRFIGLYLARQLIEAGHEVTLLTRGKKPVVSRYPPPPPPLLPHPPTQRLQIAYHTCCIIQCNTYLRCHVKAPCAFKAARPACHTLPARPDPHTNTPTGATTHTATTP
jgi:hypothetical protein